METKHSKINRAMIAEIRYEQKAKGLTAKEMVQRSGIAKGTWNRMVSRDPRDVNVTQIEGAAFALEMHPAELVRKAVIRAESMDEYVEPAEMSEAPAHNTGEVIQLRPETAEEFDKFSGPKAATERDDGAMTPDE